MRWRFAVLILILPALAISQRVTPPTIIFHDTDDNTVPFKTVELFWEKMKTLGNRCVLIGYDGADHGFFNYGRDDNAYFIDAVNKMDAFLVSLGYLKGARNTVYRE